MASLLVLYDPAVVHVPTIEEHLLSFSRFSRHRVFYSAATHDAVATDLSRFDGVVCHYSVRLCLEQHLSRSYVSGLQQFRGVKALFIQDEYETTENARRAIERLGFDIVFTCVPPEHLQKVYPQGRFPSVQFVHNLTGYVPSKLEVAPPPQRTPRPYLIGYRGRKLPYWYGDLGQEKTVIGERMKALCRQRGIPHDIEWEEEHRIYGDGWYDFLRRCRATLGTESGANVFDDDGEIRSGIEEALRQKPNATYEEIRPRFIAPHEGKVEMNQISPRIFEAIACRTALVLFEGQYSGVVRPGEHYLPLRKDFVNADEVLDRLQDPILIDRMIERAYADVISSGRFGYRTFISLFDEVLAPHVAAAARSARRDPDWLTADRPLTSGEWAERCAVHASETQSWFTSLQSAARRLGRRVFHTLPGNWQARIRERRATWHRSQER